MRVRALIVIAALLLSGCDFLFQMDRLPEAPDLAPAVVGISAVNDCSTCNKVTLDVTVEPGRPHPLLLVSVSASFSSNSAAPAVSSVMLGQDSFTFVARALAADGTKPAIEQWLLVDPPEGAGSVEVTLAAKVDTLLAGIVQIEGASNDPLRSTNSAGSPVQGKAADNEVDSAELDLVIDTVCAGTSIDAPRAGQHIEFVNNVTSAQTCGNLGASSTPGAPSVSIHWDVNAAANDHWIDMATSIRPAP